MGNAWGWTWAPSSSRACSWSPCLSHTRVPCPRSLFRGCHVPCVPRVPCGSSGSPPAPAWWRLSPGAHVRVPCGRRVGLSSEVTRTLAPAAGSRLPTGSAPCARARVPLALQPGTQPLTASCLGSGQSQAPRGGGHRSGAGVTCRSPTPVACCGPAALPHPGKMGSQARKGEGRHAR